MKRFMAFILVVVAILCCCSIASAETRDSDYFATYGIALSAPGSGKVNITFSCSSVGTASQLGVSTYSIHRYDSDDGTWEVISGPHNGSYSYGSSSHSFAKTFQGVAGEKYRVRCTFLCTKNGTTETKSYTSRTITAK